MSRKKDNSTLRHKARLRRKVLAELNSPVILETHGGFGQLYAECYSQIEAGCVIEKDDAKADVLARQRPCWAVYQGNCEKLLSAGAGSHLKYNLIDVDPYGSPFETIDAILSDPMRPLADELHLLVNDGLRKRARLNVCWTTHGLKDIVAQFGNNLFDCWLDVAKLKIIESAKQLGYELAAFYGYYCGHGYDMSHYHATLRR